ISSTSHHPSLAFSLHYPLPIFVEVGVSGLFDQRDGLLRLVRPRAIDLLERGTVLLTALRHLKWPDDGYDLLSSRIDHEKELLHRDRKSTRLNSSHQII